jgi:hypothetical protein
LVTEFRQIEKTTRRKLVAYAAMLLLLLSGFSGFGATLQEMEAFFAGTGSRAVGTAGNLETEARVAKVFADSGFTHGEINFDAPSFQPGKTMLTIEGMAPLNVRPMHPTLVRPGNFTEREFKSKLVYLGHGSFEDLEAVKSQNLKGTIAVMEFDSGSSWMRFMRFGVRGFIFIEPDEYTAVDSYDKVYFTEVAVPRFLIDKAAGKRLREHIKGNGAPISCSVDAEPSTWKNTPVRNLWVMVPGATDLEKEVAVVTAPIDSNCVVPELATGAQSGANLYMLLELLEQFKRNPPGRSVMLVAINAHTHAFRGEQMLGWHMLAHEINTSAMRDTIVQDIQLQDIYVEYYKRLKLDSTDNEDDRKLLIELRAAEDKTTSRIVALKEPIVALCKRDINSRKGDMVHLRRTIEDEEESERQILALRELNQHYVNVLTLFNRVRPQTELSDLDKTPGALVKELDILRDYVDEIIRRNESWGSKNRADYNRSTSNDRVREALGGRTVVFSVALELNWSNQTIGFTSDPTEYITNRINWARPFGLITTKLARNLAAKQSLTPDPFVDTLTNVGGLSEQHYVPEPVGPGRYLTNAGTNNTSGAKPLEYSVPTFGLRNTYSRYSRSFTPADRFENLDGSTIEFMFDYVPALFDEIFAEGSLAPGSGNKAPALPAVGRAAYALQVKSYKFDEFSASVLPDLPVPNSVVIIYMGLDPTTDPTYPIGSPIVGGDVLTANFRLTDDRATAMFYCLYGEQMPTAAYAIDEDFVKIHHIIDAGAVHAKVVSDIDEKTKHNDAKVFALFACEEYPVYDNVDVSKIEYKPISENGLIVLDGRRNATPRRYGISTGVIARSSKTTPPYGNGPLAVYLTAEDSLKLLTGQQTVRLARINSTAVEGEEEGHGLTPEQHRQQPDVMLGAARDMAHLNHYRLHRLEGVKNELAQGFLDRGASAIEAIDKAAAANDHNAYLQHGYEALGAERKAYMLISGITADMLTAIVFYMALLLPFCFFIQKLLFKFVRIEAQMAMFCVLFIGTFLLFSQIHPAFKVAEAPAAIFIAFVMFSLGAFVIHILHSRFEGEMQMLFQTYTGMDTADVGYSTVGQKAMLIGVNNMKRRRVRTALTTTTIVLITFTMLAFSSISRTVSPTIVPISKQSAYTGIYFQLPGALKMDEPTRQTIVDMFQNKAESLAVRRWLVPTQPGANQPVTPFRVDATTGSAEIEGVLGLQMSDRDFLGSGIPLVDVEGCRYFSSNSAAEVLLPLGMANALGVTEDMIGKASITFYGRKLLVVGLVDDERLRGMRDLSNRPILPIKAIQTGAFADTADNGVESNLQIDATSQDQSGVFYADTASLILIPEELCRQLGGKPFSVSVKFKDTAEVWPHVDYLLTATQAKFFIGSRGEMQVGASKNTASAGMYYIGSGYKTSVGGLARLIIPLLIAATIILNTMLGAVFERKSEIAVYNAIGLNPQHIRMFFFAEAFVYGIIGAVGGYLIGQMLSIFIREHTNIEGINLNFSSLGVFVVILFSIAVVMLSTIYPTMVATRAAVPSGKRKWSLPDNDGTRMELAFPFIYNSAIVIGIMGYLTDYFARFTEASTGNLIVTNELHRSGKDDKGRDVYSVSYDTALAPFDLGVTQHIEFTAKYDDIVESYRLHMTITRLSGQDSNWAATNVPFMEKLRKYMMHWRNLESSQHHSFVEQAQTYFTDATAKKPELNS